MIDDGPLPEDRVAVSGAATRGTPADHASWTLVVSEAGDVPAAAFERCTERLDGLTRRLREALGQTAEIRTGALRVMPQHDDHGRPRRAVDVTGEVSVRVPLADAGAAAGAAMSAGADRLRGPALEVAGRAAIAEELLGEAVAAARRKAERIAAAAGRRLGRVVSVAEDADAVPLRAVAMSGRTAFEPELEPADAGLTAHVRVVFALED